MRVPCLCDGRTDIRCDGQHCDLAGPGEAGNANECRVCWLRLNRPPPHESRRTAPCLFLGDIVDKRGCACPAKWLRRCAVHDICNLDQCKICPDYEAM
ncbi:MAG: hypothetical protein ACRELG_30655 [Gemmataceae bacterium]